MSDDQDSEEADASILRESENAPLSHPEFPLIETSVFPQSSKDSEKDVDTKNEPDTQLSEIYGESRFQAKYRQLLNNKQDFMSFFGKSAKPKSPVSSYNSPEPLLSHHAASNPLILQDSEHLLFDQEIANLTEDGSLKDNSSTINGNVVPNTTERDLTGLKLLEARSNSIDEVISQLYQKENDSTDEFNHVRDAGILDKPHTEKESFSMLLKDKRGPMKYLMAIFLLILSLVCALIFSSFPLFSCQHKNGACFPQLTVQITDKSPAAKTALVTVKEALKVLTYLAMDFGDSSSELDLINSRLDTYYQEKVIDTFSVNTLYQLNFLGYCRISSRKGRNFCMKSFGLDLLSVFVRDAGVQLGELTRTNVDIMGDSFAIAYELAITGFNQFTNKENHSVEYIDYAILLQKFSKGLGFLTVSQFVIGCILLAFAILLLVLKYKFVLKRLSMSQSYIVKKWFLISMVSLSFLNLFTGFLICSLTFEFILRLSEVGQNVGIANVNRASGFSFIWITFVFEVFTCCFVIYLANGFRKRMF